MIVRQSVETVAKPVFIKQRCNHHGIYNASVDRKTHAPYPPCIVLGIVHNFIGVTFKDFLEPFINNPLVEVSATKVTNGYVSRPIGGGYGIAHHLPVGSGPTRPQGFKIRVFCFDINCYFFCIPNIGKLDGRNPFRFRGKHCHL